MNILITFLLAFIKTFNNGTLENYSTDPADPADLGDPLTQDEIDWVKKVKKEMDERFAPLP